MSVPPSPHAARLFDAQGCLTEAAIQLLLHAPPGRAPGDLAAHLAGCARCQDRLLAASVPGPKRGAPRPAPSLRRMLILVSLILLSMLLFFVSLQRFFVP
jgi:hypothetical protein